MEHLVSYSASLKKAPLYFKQNFFLPDVQPLIVSASDGWDSYTKKNVDKMKTYKRGDAICF